ncbi:MAG: DNA polymerase III subunit gamma/tau [Succinivibrionaceae bacterium]
MSDYTVLARKYRPQKFEDLVGQKHVLSALTNALKTKRLHHAYLLTGTRGVGKTTIARILAKSFNCEKGITDEPCCVCANCKAIADGTFPDLIEIDAASRTKVDDTRELLDNVQYKPLLGRYKVYIIDEVHMLSNSSFNALLKTLEEPPEYVKFILATTDPQKLPITVVSRCLQFQLKALTLDDICHQLKHVLSLENISYEDDAVAELARAAAGSMRDALSLTDQSIALGSGNITLQTVLDMIGTLDNSYLTELIDVVASNNGSILPGVLLKIASITPDFDALHVSLARIFHDIALYQIVGNGNNVYSLRTEVISEYAKKFSPEELQLYYQIILEGRRELPYAPDGLSAFQMTMVRLLAFNLKKKVNHL